MTVDTWGRTFLILTLLASLSGCYRMPTENDYSVVPTINNPDVTREKRTTQLPGIQY